MDWLVRTCQTWHWLVVRGSFSQDPNVLFLQVERKFAHEEFILFFALEILCLAPESLGETETQSF
jgi:hypothetical protein